MSRVIGARDLDRLMVLRHSRDVTTALLWIVLAGVLGIAFWITQLVKDLNERFDQIEEKLDLISDRIGGRNAQE